MEIYYYGYNNKKLFCNVWDVKNPIGIVQIIHGMQEHSFRYFDFAKFLNNLGYTVYAPDLRGHGKNILDNKNGYSKGNITLENILDQIELSKFIKTKYPSIPLTIFGHSYGSMITQNYITKTNIYDKAIICGSAYTKTALFFMGAIVSNLTCFFKGREKEAKLIENMSIKAYGKKFQFGNWLSNDDKVWEKYKADKLCGQPFPASFYQSMFTTFLNNYKNVTNIDNKKPLLIISGLSDPVGDNGKSVKKLYNFYNKKGLNVKLNLYNNCKHELLNENIKEKIYDDIYSFIK